MELDVLVVGAGQAGLAAGYHLRRAGLRFVLADAAARVGDSWRQRYASLTLFTPRGYSSLPGLPMPGNRDQYPARDEFADYLETYAKTFDLPLSLQTPIVRLGRSQAGFEAHTGAGGTLRAYCVIVATGGFQVPVVPALADGFGPDVLQLTAGSYRAPDQITGGTVLVVGDGASGRDIAVELATRRETLLAAGKPRRLFPERVLGKSIWWWLDLIGVMRAGPNSFVGRRVREADAFPDRDRSVAALRRLGVLLKPRLIGAEGSKAVFGDGTQATVSTIIWCVGYRDDAAWIDLPGARDASGRLLHEEGVSPVEGFFFVGRPWQRNRASALVMGAGPDAGAIVERILARPAAGRGASG